MIEVLKERQVFDKELKKDYPAFNDPFIPLDILKDSLNSLKEIK